MSADISSFLVDSALIAAVTFTDACFESTRLTPSGKYSVMSTVVLTSSSAFVTSIALAGTSMLVTELSAAAVPFIVTASGSLVTLSTVAPSPGVPEALNTKSTVLVPSISADMVTVVLLSLSFVVSISFPSES